ncbi:hypothetical protein [Mycobacterium alsense]|uniref:hypothetical protein n=1 Tax=Mycobacterium alsense TaxID=324058 RepID=UPI0010421CC0|nr:hypothetical protein [Mycobacterium alsense]
MSEDDDEQPDQVWLRPREYESGAERWQSAAIDHLLRAIHPVLAQIGREKIHDVPDPGETSTAAGQGTPLSRVGRVQHDTVWSPEEVLAFDVDSYLCRIYEAADSIGGQMVRAMFDHISAVCDENGQTVNVEGRNFFDALIETTEKLEMDFDEEGKPTTMIVVNPETLKKLQADGPTPEQEKRLQAVLDRKREEWSASRSRRELP